MSYVFLVVSCNTFISCQSTIALRGFTASDWTTAKIQEMVSKTTTYHQQCLSSCRCMVIWYDPLFMNCKFIHCVALWGYTSFCLSMTSHLPQTIAITWRSKILLRISPYRSKWHYSLCLTWFVWGKLQPTNCWDRLPVSASKLPSASSPASSLPSKEKVGSLHFYDFLLWLHTLVGACGASQGFITSSSNSLSHVNPWSCCDEKHK